MTLWTVARKASPSMEFSRQGHGSGLPFPPPGDFPNPGMEPESLTSPALASEFFTIAPPLAVNSQEEVRSELFKI